MRSVLAQLDEELGGRKDIYHTSSYVRFGAHVGAEGHLEAARGLVADAARFRGGEEAGKEGAEGSVHQKGDMRRRGSGAIAGRRPS